MYYKIQKKYSPLTFKPHMHYKSCSELLHGGVAKVTPKTWQRHPINFIQT